MKMRYSTFKIQRVFITFILFVVLYCLYTIFYTKYHVFQFTTDEVIGRYCHQPKLDINDTEIMKFIKFSPRIRCPGEDWVKIEGNVAKITEEAKKKYGNVECHFTDVIRSSDYSTLPGVSTNSHTEYLLEGSDFIRVYCRSSSGAMWENKMAGIRADDDILERIGWQHVPKDSLKLNVLIFGFDSLSRMTFMRKLPKTYRKLISMDTIVLEGYNILGDGTPQALIPMLTGQTELELPDTRRRMGTKATYVNVYPFVWNDYQKHGYVTAFMEDTPHWGIFTYRLKGFSTEPVDHYMRTYYVDAIDDFDNQKPYCMASTPRHKIMLDYARHMFTVYPRKPKFVFGFHGELSHDSYNLIGGADDDVVEWLQWFEDNGHLNNTVLIFMSDHGHRFASVRSTQQGKLEERLPFFSFRFPSWFKDSYPKAYANFKTNVHRLTTPFDVHQTLLSILYYDGTEYTPGSRTARNISLFKEIPKSRTCLDAQIEPHWCACLMWEKVNKKSELVKRAAFEFVQFINRYIFNYSKLCSKLKLVEILQAAKLLPNERVLAFKQAGDADGFIPDLSGKTILTKEIYQIKVITDPGFGLFEFSSTYHIKKETFSFEIADVSRINMYGNASSCIQDDEEQLRKYCYCKT